MATKCLLARKESAGNNQYEKSNLYEAINFARYTVLHGVKQNKLVNKHFRIDSQYLNKPGVFQFDIYSNGHFYSYGFAISYTKAIVIAKFKTKDFIGVFSTEEGMRNHGEAYVLSRKL